MNPFPQNVHLYGLPSPRWRFLCTVKDSFRINDRWHLSHANFLSARWTTSWAFRLEYCLNFLKHTLQVNGLAPLWILWCTVSVSLRLNDAPHTSHLWFLFEWTDRCFLKFDLLPNVLGQIEHLNGLSSFTSISSFVSVLISLFTLSFSFVFASSLILWFSIVISCLTSGAWCCLFSLKWRFRELDEQKYFWHWQQYACVFVFMFCSLCSTFFVVLNSSASNSVLIGRKIWFSEVSSLIRPRFSRYFWDFSHWSLNVYNLYAFSLHFVQIFWG